MIIVWYRLCKPLITIRSMISFFIIKKILLLDYRSASKKDGLAYISVTVTYIYNLCTLIVYSTLKLTAS